MSERGKAAPAKAPATTPAMSPKEKAAKKAGPPFAVLILKAVTASKDPKGISYQALRKALAARGCDHTAHIKRAVKRLLEKGALVQLKGKGATGSFKAAEKTKKAAKKPAAESDSSSSEEEETRH
ncbi:hypothetical protein CgunFtcFv8_009897 [Champsocephalus gunnari]|uniref:H15 domain-containing protein n=1 Tax=Champsocephalus gunnari TaxID=52237 RepID=A0AAN8C3V2_CHAGU|nr:hypothetical protein CgunFtcFv8_009897 [Champsocephalus gunnari]